MIEISRALARRLRTVFRKAVPIGAMRGHRLPLSLHAGEDGLCVRSHHPEAVAEYRVTQPMSACEILLPGEALDDFEGRGEGVIAVEAVGPESVRATWNDGGVPQARIYNPPGKEKLQNIPCEPKALRPVEHGFLTALADATLCCAREAVRFSICKIQLRGDKGEIVATDGKQLLLQNGFTFPWREDLLIPALNVFGTRELAQEDQLFIGRTDTHVCLRAGPWALYMAIDARDRFPDVESVIPKVRGGTTTCTLSAADASFLNEALPRLPGKEGDHEPVTLDLHDRVAVRARAEGQEQATEMVLAHSTVTGPPVRVVFNRLYLRRAVNLGFREIEITKPNVPIVCKDAARTYVVMPLDPACAIPPGEHHICISSGGGTPTPLPSPPPATTSHSPIPRKRRFLPVPRIEEAVNGHKANGHQSNGHPDNSPSLDNLIVEADSLRASLAELCGRFTQFGVNLKRLRRRDKAIDAALSALRLKLPALP